MSVKINEIVQRYNAPSSIAAIIMMGLVGSTIPVISPSLIKGLHPSRGLETSVAAPIMSAEMVGMNISTTIMALLEAM